MCRVAALQHCSRGRLLRGVFILCRPPPSVLQCRGHSCRGDMSSNIILTLWEVTLVTT